MSNNNDKGKSSGGAWGSGRLKNSSGGSSSNEGSGNKPNRPPPGMDGGSRKDFGSERRSSSQGSSGGGWGRSGSNSSNGYAKKTYPPASQNNNNKNNTQNNQDNSHQHILRERFLHLILSMVGQNVTLTQTSGRVLEGIFHTFSPFNSLKEDMRNMYCLKAVRVIKKGKDGSDDKPVKDGTTVLINANKVANVQVKSMRLDAVNSAANDGAPTPGEVNDAAFATDSQISGGRGGNQSLVAAGNAWTAAGDGGLGGLESSSSKALGGGKGSDALNWRRGATPNKSGSKSAPSSGGLPSGDMKGSIGDWDQFSANEKKFGVKTSFDENLYTTKLDHSKMDDKKRLEAERIAREIEGTVSTNIHIATERNQALAMDFDDEDLYSGVLTKDLKARVVPDSDKKGEKLNFAAAAKKGTADTPPKDGDKGVSEEGESPPDLSKMKVSSEEKKDENEGTNKKSDNKSDDDTKKDKAEEKKDEKKTGETKLKLNPNAKTFSFNPGAKTFTPTFSAPAPAPMQALPPMDGQMMPPQEYPGGAPMMGGMGAPQYPIPGGMMPVHPQMRQQYPPGPYGQQPLPPMPPQQGGGAPQTAPQGPDDGGSVNTGESDNATPSQQPQQQQPYMQQPGPYGAPPPGAYPYAPQYGQMQGRYPMHPGQQMHQPVLPPGGPRPMYPQQYMGGAPQMMSQYPPQHMGGGPMHRNQPYYNGPPQGYNPQQHGGNNPDHDNKNRNNNNNNNQGRGQGRGHKNRNQGGKYQGRGGRGGGGNNKHYQHQNSQESGHSGGNKSSNDGGGGNEKKAQEPKAQEKAQDVSAAPEKE